MNNDPYWCYGLFMINEDITGDCLGCDLMGECRNKTLARQTGRKASRRVLKTATSPFFKLLPEAITKGDDHGFHTTARSILPPV